MWDGFPLGRQAWLSELIHARCVGSIGTHPVPHRQRFRRACQLCEICQVLQQASPSPGRRWVHHEERESSVGVRNWSSGWRRTCFWYGAVRVFETSRSLIDVPCAEIPVNEYYEYFGPDYELDVKSSNAEDMNTPSYLERVRRIVMDNLRHAGGPPSVQMSGAC